MRAPVARWCEAGEDNTMTSGNRLLALMRPPLPTPNTAPETLVRSEIWPDARGIFLGVSPGASLWVCWRKPGESIPSWDHRIETMRVRLAQLRRAADLGWGQN